MPSLLRGDADAWGTKRADHGSTRSIVLGSLDELKPFTTCLLLQNWAADTVPGSKWSLGKSLPHISV